MQAAQTETGRSPGADPAESVRVWIEDGRGSIARGLVEVISEDRAFIRLTEAASVGSGDQVAVRLSFDPESPTMGAAARVLWIRAEGGSWECELEWTHTGPERARLASLVAGLG
jgi:hypothetical protein